MVFRKNLGCGGNFELHPKDAPFRDSRALFCFQFRHCASFAIFHTGSSILLKRVLYISIVADNI